MLFLSIMIFFIPYSSSLERKCSFSKSLHQLNNEEVSNFRLQLTCAVSNSSFQINTQHKGCTVAIHEAFSIFSVEINCYTALSFIVENNIINLTWLKRFRNEIIVIFSQVHWHWHQFLSKPDSQTRLILSTLSNSLF